MDVEIRLRPYEMDNAALNTINKRELEYMVATGMQERHGYSYYPYASHSKVSV